MAEHVFGKIQLGSRGGSAEGSLKVTKAGLSWKKASGNRTVEVPADDIKGLAWSKLSRGCMLTVRRASAPALALCGFRDADAGAVGAALGVAVADAPVATAGHNWGAVALDGPTLEFRVGGRPAFRLALPDVADAQQARDDVALAFPADDTAGGAHQDALAGVSFYVPRDCPEFAPPAPAAPADGDAPAAAPPPAAAVFAAAVAEHTAAVDAGAAVATFDSVGVAAPRGRFDVELYGDRLKLAGQAADFRVGYDAILRVFVLPRAGGAASAQTLVALWLDPPLRKGQTTYPCVLCVFDTEEEATVELDLDADALARLNARGARLEPSMSGPAHDVFARVLRGLSGAKLTRPGAFRDAEGSGVAVRCSYRSDDGWLYPLERAFFYVQKPPLLLPYEDVAGVEFLRQAEGGVTAAKTFDLAVRMRSGADHTFRNIPRPEWTNLLEFFGAKGLRIENFKAAAAGPGAAPRLGAGDGPDAGLAKMAALGDSDGGGGGDDDDEDDDDFAASSDSSSGDGDSDGSGSDSDGGGGAGGEDKGKKPAAEKKRKAAPAGGGGDGAAAKPKAKRAKKDPNAPKKALSAFMFFSSANRDAVKADNPGIAFGEVGKVLGAKWKELDADARAPYEAQAAADKERYEAQMKEWKASQAAGGAAGKEEEPAAAAGGGGGDDD